VHPLADIIRFRMLMIAAGYEDGNDADSLRTDPLFKLALERLPSERDLCSQSTISRLENLPDKRTRWIHISSATPRLAAKASMGVWYLRHFRGVELRFQITSSMSAGA
jgi:hypothetical protein